MTSLFDEYSRSIAKKNTSLAKAIEQTRDQFENGVLSEFDWASDKQVLLYGDVQSGKTSHMLGLIAHAADQGITNAILLTSDNTLLVQQTFKRALNTLRGVNVCAPKDELRFESSLEDTDAPLPNLIVLNKNASILRQWKITLANADKLSGQPLLIVDDEADAASLDNNVNNPALSDRTEINKQLSEIRSQSASCIYLQVTGTPQSILLQAKQDGWRPDLAFSFSPGPGYVGGDLLFDNVLGNPYLEIVTEAIGFRKAVINHLATSAIFKILGEQTCNMLVHPSHRQGVHADFANDAKSIVSEIQESLYSPGIQSELGTALSGLQRTFNENISLRELSESLENLFAHNEPSIVIVNANSEVKESDWQFGSNILIGGNSLGRGLTVGRLQTVYYSRPTKAPQADTLWQHARMFGYDRRPELLRVFMPGEIAKVFKEVHEGNKAIKSQISRTGNLDTIQIVLTSGIKPTRSTVVNSESLQTFHGGVNYFSGDPTISDWDLLEERVHNLTKGSNDELEVSVNSLVTLLQFISADPQDFPVDDFISALQQQLEDNPSARGVLITRRGRKVRKGTGSLLSETDRNLADSIDSIPVLVLYRIEGDLGWSRSPIWVPNIKLPKGPVYYRSK